MPVEKVTVSCFLMEAFLLHGLLNSWISICLRKKELQLKKVNERKSLKELHAYIEPDLCAHRTRVSFIQSVPVCRSRWHFSQEHCKQAIIIKSKKRTRFRFCKYLFSEVIVTTARATTMYGLHMRWHKVKKNRLNAFSGVMDHQAVWMKIEYRLFLVEISNDIWR